ncbi:Tox-REase-5 domain-containing protein [Archangium violaceum]|uniref:Tox-REase-5 domain-containing protein n=1 Tax=Archangium violaceum TaxID=83451 RepID=UPI002B2A5643|nr:Tox-REase-5 domain-containing protein [Archangium gephyra]
MSTRCAGAFPSGVRLILALALAVLLGGCATGPPRASLTSGFGLHSRPAAFRVPVALGEMEGSAGGFPEQAEDSFQVVQEASGLGEDARHPVGAALYLEQARQVLGQLAKTPVTQRSLAPRRALSWLLREVLEGGERVDYADLKWRAERFERLVLVRPDGYLVAALDGTPLQRQGPLKLVDGEWWVGRLVVGAFSILHMAGRGRGKSGDTSDKTEKDSKTAPAREPGRWTYKKPTTESKRSLDYQEQVTGRPAWWVYMIGDLEFDGIKLGELLEAKGPGYCSFFNADGTPKYWFHASGGFTQMMEQAENQSKMAQRLGRPLSWHVADAKVAEYLRELFKGRGWKNITVHHTWPVQ